MTVRSNNIAILALMALHRIDSEQAEKAWLEALKYSTERMFKIECDCGMKTLLRELKEALRKLDGAEWKNRKRAHNAASFFDVDEEKFMFTSNPSTYRSTVYAMPLFDGYIGTGVHNAKVDLELWRKCLKAAEDIIDDVSDWLWDNFDMPAKIARLLDERLGLNAEAKRAVGMPPEMAMPYENCQPVGDMYELIKGYGAGDEQLKKAELESQQNKPKQESKPMFEKQMNTIKKDAAEMTKLTLRRQAGRTALSVIHTAVFKKLPLKWSWWARVTGKKQRIIEHPLTKVATAASAYGILVAVRPEGKELAIARGALQFALDDAIDKGFKVDDMVSRALGVNESLLAELAKAFENEEKK